jgi:uncharacterized phiE125 gp8 family phage protein
MELTLVTASTGDPITLTDAKEHLYITSNDRDVEIAAMLSAATNYCQRRIGGHRQFVQATYDGVVPAWPIDQRLTMDLPPLSSVTSVKYFDSDGTEQTLSSTAYDTVTPTDSPGYIEPVFGTTWPTARNQHNAVTVRFVAGYGSADEVPDTVKAAIKLTLGHLFCNRSEVVTGTIVTAMKKGVDALLACNEYGHYG